MSTTPQSFAKFSPELAAAFDAALPDDPRVERRRMFGCPCAFVQGQMFAGTHEHRLIVRVPAEAPQRPFSVMGRTMREYAAFEQPLAMRPAERAAWVKRGFDYAAGLPPKPAKLAKLAKPAKAAKASTAAAAPRTAKPAKKK
jgi:TfoX/Sxy family transcriptional regulator of competence genes